MAQVCGLGPRVVVAHLLHPSNLRHINDINNNNKGRRPSGAVLHSSREPVVRRPCSDLVDMLRRLINCCRIIIIH